MTVTQYGYDANGNTVSEAEETYGPSTGLAMTVEIGGDGWTLYEYNGLNQQVGVTKDGVETSYVYKPNGLRLSKSTNGLVTKHIWDGGNIIVDVVGASVVKYLRGANLIYAEASSVKSYYGYNGHGDVMQLNDGGGAVTKTYRYDAFGVEQEPVTNDTNVWRYCGEYWDVETETYYLRARYYNPRIGRFTQSDPAMDGLNWYTYCVNNPVRYWDPSGRAITQWDLEHCTPGEIDLLKQYTDNWVVAEARGDTYGMSLWHNKATAIRKPYLETGQVVREDGQIGVGSNGDYVVSKQVVYGMDQSTQNLQAMQATYNQSPEEVKTEVVVVVENNILPLISTIADITDNAFSAGAGLINGSLEIKGLSDISGLEIASNVIMGVAIGVNVLSSGYERFGMENEYTTTGNVILFAVDMLEIGLTSTVSYITGAAVSTIPVVGPFIAVPVGWVAGKIVELPFKYYGVFCPAKPSMPAMSSSNSFYPVPDGFLR